MTFNRSSFAERALTWEVRERELREDGSCIVGRADELEDGERWLVKVGVRTIGVFRMRGEFFAILNRCPHQGAELCRGDVFPKVTSDGPDSYDFDSGRFVLSCPWHAWEFDLETGESVFDPTGTRVKAYQVCLEDPKAETFPTEVRGGWVVVQLQSGRRSAP
jgi:nitrite reductase/ring-hydroxylating ferredoxin subunit